MPKNTYATPYDLITPDGKIVHIERTTASSCTAELEITNIHENFVGYQLDKEDLTFNIKSTFAQLGINGVMTDVELSPNICTARVQVTLYSFNDIGTSLLSLLKPGVFTGKLFAKDPRRIIRSRNYLDRLFGKSDHQGNPLLVFSEEYSSEEIIDDAANNRVLVRIPLRSGYFEYDDDIKGFLPTVVKGLCENKPSFRRFLYLHQEHKEGPRVIQKNDFLLVKTTRMSIRTLFSRVAHDMLPEGYKHASADILHPQMTSGDIFEFHSEDPNNPPQEEISHIPLEFYSLEPYREFFFFSDKDLLREDLEKKNIVFNALDTAPKSADDAAIFIVKKFQLEELNTSDWIVADPKLYSSLPMFPKTREEKSIISEYIQRQAEYPILKSMQEGHITSQGILFSKHFTSNLLSTFLLNEHVARCLHGIYFLEPSITHGKYFSHDDRTLLRNLAKQDIDVYWADKETDLLLKYVPRQDMDTGLFVPTDKIKDYENATIFGVYGSRFEISTNEEELRSLFEGLIEMQIKVDHDLFHKGHRIAIATGGGPGVMAVGNLIASELGLLSIGHAVDFRRPHEAEEPGEAMNHYIQGRMTYRLEQVIIRQSEFGLDFPIFCEGGIGTDFEYALELLRIQVGTRKPSPILLFGEAKYWKAKIRANHQENLERGTIKGSEWISNCFYCVQNHKQALTIYYKFFTGSLPIGKEHKGHPDGFITWK